MRLQILSLTILVGVGSKVGRKSAWSPSYEKITLEIAKIWTTPVDGILIRSFKGKLGVGGSAKPLELLKSRPTPVDSVFLVYYK